MSICVSSKDVVKYGCPYCNFRSSRTSLSGRGASVCSCGECDKNFTVLADGLDQSPFRVSDSEGVLRYEELKEHPRKHTLARGTLDEPPQEGEWFFNRGIGTDKTNGCMFCKKSSNMSNNLTGFMRTKEAGLRLLDSFDKLTKLDKDSDELNRIGARLDYRDYEPDYLQFKIGACNNCKPKLKLLRFYTSLTNTITKDYLEKAKNLEWTTLKESMIINFNTQKQISENYVKQDSTSIYRKGTIDAYEQILSYIESIKESQLKTSILSYSNAMVKISETYYSQDRTDDYNRGKIHAFSEVEDFINYFTTFNKKAKNKHSVNIKNS